MSILGFDLGTGACKGVAFDSVGNILAKAEKGYDTYSPNPGWCELDPNEFINAIREVCLSIRAKIPNDEPIAVAFSSHGETIIPVGYDRKPVGPAYMNADNRAVVEVEELIKKIPAKRIYEITGTPPHPMYGLANILWVKAHEPERYEATDKFCPPEGFLMAMMGFEPVCNYSNCCRNMAFDIRKKEWSQEILDAAGIRVERMCKPVPSGQLVGQLDEEHAELFGLPEGISVVTGGFDHFSTSIGSGAIHKGMVSCSCGTYEGLTTLSDEPNSSDEAFDCCLNTFCHLDGKYSNFVYVPAGMGTKWMVNEVCAAERIKAEEQGKSVYQYLAEEVDKLPKSPTDIYFAPHLVGSCTPYNNPAARGVIYGITPYTTRPQLYKATYECIAYEYTQLCDLLDKMVGGFDLVRMSGGGARSEFALQLRCDNSGKTIECLETDEAPALGVAILAGVAVGVFDSLEDGLEKNVRIRTTVKPNIETTAKYADARRIYDTLYRSLAPVRDGWKL